MAKLRNTSTVGQIKVLYLSNFGLERRSREFGRNTEKIQQRFPKEKANYNYNNNR